MSAYPSNSESVALPSNLMSGRRASAGNLARFTSGAADEVARFAAGLTLADRRWTYCHGLVVHSDGFFDKSAMGSCQRFLGTGYNIEWRIRQMTKHGGVAGARARFTHIDMYDVGAMEPWQIGHVYFARLVKFPWVMKIGFSRRVDRRLAEVESKSGERVIFCGAEVGIKALENWHHREAHANRISGEWFFDSAYAERDLPAFLAHPVAA